MWSDKIVAWLLVVFCTIYVREVSRLYIVQLPEFEETE